MNNSAVSSLYSFILASNIKIICDSLVFFHTFLAFSLQKCMKQIWQKVRVQWTASKYRKKGRRGEGEHYRAIHKINSNKWVLMWVQRGGNTSLIDECFRAVKLSTFIHHVDLRNFTWARGEMYIFQFCYNLYEMKIFRLQLFQLHHVVIYSFIRCRPADISIRLAMILFLQTLVCLIEIEIEIHRK